MEWRPSPQQPQRGSGMTWAITERSAAVRASKSRRIAMASSLYRHSTSAHAARNCGSVIRGGISGLGAAEVGRRAAWASERGSHSLQTARRAKAIQGTVRGLGRGGGDQTKLAGATIPGQPSKGNSLTCRRGRHRLENQGRRRWVPVPRTAVRTHSRREHFSGFTAWPATYAPEPNWAPRRLPHRQQQNDDREELRFSRNGARSPRVTAYARHTL
jgi:hypothetical protein